MESLETSVISPTCSQVLFVISGLWLHFGHCSTFAMKEKKGSFCESRCTCVSNQHSEAEAHLNNDPKNSQISEQPSFTVMFDPLNKYKTEPEKTYFYPLFF